MPMDLEDSNSGSSKCNSQAWLEGLGTFLSGLGTVLTGLAACFAVWFAKDPIKNYFADLRQTQMVIVNTCEAKRQVDELIEKSDDPVHFGESFETIPSEIPKNPGQPMGLFILPEFRDQAKLEVLKAESPETKRIILKNYWEKSLSEETKTNVDLKINGEK